MPATRRLFGYLAVALVVALATVASMIFSPVTEPTAATNNPCDSDGITVGYSASYVAAPPPGGYRVMQADVDGINSDCIEADLLVALLDDGVQIATGTTVIPGTSATVAFLAPPSVNDVDGVHVSIDGELITPDAGGSGGGGPGPGGGGGGGGPDPCPDGTEDVDGDGVCEEVAGRVLVTPRITIHYSQKKKAFVGRVFGLRRRCRTQREVRLYKVDGVPRKLGSDITGARGYWRVDSNKRPNGKFRALLARKRFEAANGDIVICLEGRSRKLVRNRHRGGRNG